MLTANQKKVVLLLADGNRDATHILTALRGPDGQAESIKFKYTAPIRLWFYGADQYRRLGFMPEDPKDVKPIRSARDAHNLRNAVWSDFMDEEATTRMNGHFASHIRSALLAIQTTYSGAGKGK